MCAWISTPFGLAAQYSHTIAEQWAHLFLEHAHIVADLLQVQLHLYQLRLRIRQIPDS